MFVGFITAFLIELVISFDILKYLLLAVWVVFTAAVYFWYIPAFLKSSCYQSTKAVLNVQQGVFWQQKQQIKTQNIQYYIVSHTPLETYFKIQNLQIYVAGGSVTLLALTEAQTEDILKCLFESENQNEQ